VVKKVRSLEFDPAQGRIEVRSRVKARDKSTRQKTFQGVRCLLAKPKQACRVFGYAGQPLSASSEALGRSWRLVRGIGQTVPAERQETSEADRHRQRLHKPFPKRETVRGVKHMRGPARASTGCVDRGSD
jgi:hypothetical protein